MKKLLAGSVIGLMLVLVGGAFTANWWLNHAVSDQVHQAENALASDELILLAHIDNQKITTLREMFLTPEDPQSIKQPVVNQSVIDLLTQPTEKLSVDQLFVAFAANQQQTAVNLLLSGNFDASALKTLLQPEYQIKEVSGNTFKLIEKQKTHDGFTCDADEATAAKQRKVFYLKMNQSWLAISSHIDQSEKLFQRLMDKTPAAMDLQQWQQFRKGNLFSLAIWQPQQAAEVPTGFTGAMLAGAAKKNQQLKAIFAGGSVALEQMSLLLEMQAQSSAEQAVKSADTVNKGIAEFAEQSSTISPTFAKMLQNLSAGAEADKLKVSLTLNAEMVDQAPSIISEAMSNIFSFNISTGDQQQGNKQVTEELAEDLWDYSDQLSLTRLPDYQNKKILADATNGPFAVQVNQVAIDPETGLLALTVKGVIQYATEDKGNLNAPGLKTEMLVTSVLSKDGKELLRDERCVTSSDSFFKKNQVPVTKDSGIWGLIELEQTVRLIEGAALDDIASVEVAMDYSAPEVVSTHVIEAKKGQFLQQENTRVYIKDVTPGTLAYELSGEADKLIEIRALNDNQQALKFGWGSSFGSDGVRNVSKSVSGAAKKVQLFMLEKQYQKTATLKFDLPNLTRHNNELTGVFDPVAIQPVSKAQWKRNIPATVIAKEVKSGESTFGVWDDQLWRKDFGALALIVYKSRSSWRPHITMQLLLPEQQWLMHDMGAVEFVIDQSNVTDSSIQKVVLPEVNRWTMNKQGQVKASLDIANKKYLSYVDQGVISLEKEQSLQNLTGEVRIHLPKKIRNVTTDFPGFNQIVEKDGYQITWNKLVRDKSLLYEQPYHEFVLKVQGAPNQLVNLYVVTKDQQRLAAKEVNSKDNQLLFTFELTEPARSLELVIAEKSELVRYPFTFNTAKEKLASN